MPRFMNQAVSREEGRRLVLGTAQLGMDYGIANRSGRPGKQAAEKIIEQAWESGIRIFDTAQGYGNSEEVLGRALAGLGLSEKAGVITKLDPRVDLSDQEALIDSINGSLCKLGVKSLAGLLLHSEEQLDLWPDCRKGLKEAVDQGKTSRIGVSVYSPARAIQALSLDLLDLIELPANILDNRFFKARVFEKARQKSKTVLIRSVFLQGLLLMEPDAIPEKMGFAMPALSKFATLASANGLSRRELALGHIKFNYPDALMIFGAERPEQVAANAKTWKSLDRERVPQSVRDFIENIEERVVNPTLWPN